ncbi:hypothetical protein G6F46_012328 [Rhizopus delemar]|uniref:Uncharacterized protein n=2 Tax=Rhizopus TaxID=4842 RepID=A0A9P6Z5Q4_9FUNG|nr:hypothetical protein G6F36_015058 [Rhizopus arrhizus]KAG1460759.1 hypothetical protein G6F55_003968 [Rhizopus delemar]KAG1488232.1 hypothetical protein G6F54_012178 [Rhizopus delemar]KAG1495981.1 hypothetical protein G6F53_012270 [Rhizopus delemar]KAG1506951.1 hypothetical protein G6F52_011756 [Rhizopus delemar]
MRTSTATAFRSHDFPFTWQLQTPTKRPSPSELESPPLQKASKPKFENSLPGQMAAAHTLVPLPLTKV